MQKLIEEYRSLDAFISEQNKKHADTIEPLETRLVAIKEELRAALAAAGLRSAKTDAGSVKHVTKRNVNVVDKDAFWAFIRSRDDGQDFITKTAMKERVLEYLETTQALPDGVTVDSFIDISITK
jgi:hypothetical protein